MWHDNETSRDLIGFARFARTLRGIVTEEEILPVTVGVFGDWGSGKSSVLRMLAEDLAGEDGVVVCAFDSWVFEGYDDARAAIMTSVVRAVAQHARAHTADSETVQARLLALFRGIDWMRLAAVGAAGVTLWTGGDAAEAGAVAGLVGKLGTFMPVGRKGGEEGADGRGDAGAVDIHQSIGAFRAEFEALVVGAGVRAVVVLVDDLDRCLPESLVTTLEAIKLFLLVPRTAFVIAADERIVKQAIAQRYPGAGSGEDRLAQDYLDKLVQVPVRLPHMDEIETETYVYLLLAERELEDEQFSSLCGAAEENRKSEELAQPLNFGLARECLGEAVDALEREFGIGASLAPVLARKLDGNPRLVKRFLNAIDLRERIAESEGMVLARGILAKLMVLERFHAAQFEALYRWQAAQDGVPIEVEQLEESAEESGDVKEGLEGWLGDQSLVDWIRMDPALSGVNLSSYFRLAREGLKVDIEGGRRLSRHQQEVLGLLMGESDGGRRAAERMMAEWGAEEWDTVIEAVQEQVRRAPDRLERWNGAMVLAKLRVGGAQALVESCRAISPGSIEAWVPPLVAEIVHVHPEMRGGVTELLEEWAGSSSERLASAARTMAGRLRGE